MKGREKLRTVLSGMLEFRVNGLNSLSRKTLMQRSSKISGYQLLRKSFLRLSNGCFEFATKISIFYLSDEITANDIDY